MEHVYPAQGLGLAYSSKVHLCRFEVLVPEDYLGVDFGRKKVNSKNGTINGAGQFLDIVNTARCTV